METKFKDVVKNYREAKNLSVRDFAGALTEKFVNVSLSGQTVSRWEKTPNVAPDLYFLLNCTTTYTDWRAAFAVDALKSVLPHVFDSGLITFHLPRE